jgi:RNA polymerase sigma-70 factor (ECF subfamily)
MTKQIFSWPALFSSSDEEAMCCVKLEDDPRAFARLVERWQQPIESLCGRMTGDLHRGEDLAQDTFVRLYARRKSYEPTGRFSTFLWRMALNICYDELRKARRRGEFSLDEPDMGDEPTARDFIIDECAPDLALVRDERAEAVRSALLQLAEPYRVVVVLRHYEGLKFREIADVLRIPEGTVKSRMAEALTQLNRLLNPLRGDLPKTPPSTKERLLI